MGATQKDSHVNSAESLKNIAIPVLDLFGDDDLPGVLETADRRKNSSAHNAYYSQQVIEGANHFFDGMDHDLITAVADWARQFLVDQSGNGRILMLIRRPAIFEPFRIRSYRFQWTADLVTSWALEMEALVLGWYILVETGSVLLLTMLVRCCFSVHCCRPCWVLSPIALGNEG